MKKSIDIPPKAVVGTSVSQMMLGKPVIMATTRVLNLDSGFRHKLLCTGPTFSTGTACAYSCTYCFSEAQVGTKPFVANVLAGRHFQDVVIRRQDPVGTLKQELYNSHGMPKYKGTAGEIYGSPLVDIAAVKELIEETIQIVQLILGATDWDTRLLSKSPRIVDVAKSLTPAQKRRVIFGLSTGTLNDDYARAIEPTCPSPTKRTEALRWLQDHDYRTFGMLCPILPQPMDDFIEQVLTDIRPDKCEHVWAEVINVRGESMAKTVAALEASGLIRVARDLEAVSGEGHQSEWEQYARTTFLALVKVLPRNLKEPKLRFLQYVNAASKEWWDGQVQNGAIVLGRSTKKQKAPAAPVTGVTIPLETRGKDPARVAAAKKAWLTIRANRAAASPGMNRVRPA